MSEWSKFGEVPSEHGGYVVEKIGGNKFFLKVDCSIRPDYFADKRWILIPEPPREPPKIRRFIGQHKTIGLVSGVFVPEMAGPYQYILVYREGNTVRHGWYEESVISRIDWIDEP